MCATWRGWRRMRAHSSRRPPAAQRTSSSRYGPAAFAPSRARGVSGCVWGCGSTTDHADCVIADLKAHLLSHPRLSQAALRASAQVGDPASEVRFIVEGHARMEATFINLPDTHRAIEFPIMLLTNGLEWCDACSIRWTGPAGKGVERMQVATTPGTSPALLGFRLLHKVQTFRHRSRYCRLHGHCLQTSSMELPVGQVRVCFLLPKAERLQVSVVVAVLAADMPQQSKTNWLHSRVWYPGRCAIWPAGCLSTAPARCWAPPTSS